MLLYLRLILRGRKSPKAAAGLTLIGLLLGGGDLRAQPTITTGPTVIAGGTISSAAETAIYQIALSDGGQRLIDFTVQIDPGAGAAIVAGDIASLQLYRDAAGPPPTVGGGRCSG